MLAAAERLGWDPDLDSLISTEDGGAIPALAVDSSEIPYPCMVACDLLVGEQSRLRLTDYASAGKQWSSTDRLAVWLPARFTDDRNKR